MKTLRITRAALLAVLVAAPLASAQQPPAAAGDPQAAPAPSACITCHSDASKVTRPELRAPAERLEKDVHLSFGLSCHDCHGGDPKVDVDAADAASRAHSGPSWVGKPEPQAIPAFCGRCHSDAGYMSAFDPEVRVDQEALYHTSVHGQKLAQGDTKVANCISCHGVRDPSGPGRAKAHGIRAIADPLGPVHPFNVAGTCGRCHGDADYMAEYKIPTDQYAEYNKSVHHHALVDQEDLSAPTCNDCHGNHGAKPPGVESLAYVCGNCHGKQAELFRQSAMKVAFDDMELGECIVCHGNHDIEPPSDELLAHQPPDQAPEGNVCYLCHSEADDPGLVASTKMYGALTGLEASIGEAEGVITDAEQKGMPVAQAEYQLSGARDALIEARVEIHRFVADPVLEACEKGAKIADESRSLGVAAIGEYFFRHRWLAISLLGIAFVIVCLVLKVRQVDRRWRSTIAASSPPSGDGGGAA